MNHSSPDILANMYFVVDDLAGSYSTGQVVRLVAEGIYFVRFEGAEGVLPLELVSMGEMLQSNGDDQKLWRFFETIEERRAWIDWLEAPSSPRVVSLVKPDG